MRNEDRELLRWTRIAGAEGGIVLAPIKAEGSDPDPIYRWIDLLERRRVLLERGRLLYVAATRAKTTAAPTRQCRCEVARWRCAH